MAKANHIFIRFLVVVAIASASWVTAHGSDPVVRQHLRNIDEDPKPEVSSSTTLRSEFEHLFESPTFQPPSEFRGAELRRWRDNTGAYEVQARVVMIYPDKVRLQKENGRTTTVAMRRLSPYDQAYVRWVADQMTSNLSDGLTNDR